MQSIEDLRSGFDRFSGLKKNLCVFLGQPKGAKWSYRGSGIPKPPNSELLSHLEDETEVSVV